MQASESPAPIAYCCSAPIGTRCHPGVVDRICLELFTTFERIAPVGRTSAGGLGSGSRCGARSHASQAA